VLWKPSRPTSNHAETGGGILKRLQPVNQSFRDAEEQKVAVVQATGNKRLDRFYSNLQKMSGQPACRLAQQLVVANSTAAESVCVVAERTSSVWFDDECHKPNQALRSLERSVRRADPTSTAITLTAVT